MWNILINISLGRKFAIERLAKSALLFLHNMFYELLRLFELLQRTVLKNAVKSWFSNL